MKKRIDNTFSNRYLPIKSQTDIQKSGDTLSKYDVQLPLGTCPTKIGDTLLKYDVQRPTQYKLETLSLKCSKNAMFNFKNVEKVAKP